MKCTLKPNPASCRVDLQTLVINPHTSNGQARQVRLNKLQKPRDQVDKVKVCCEHALGLWLEDLVGKRQECDKSQV